MNPCARGEPTLGPNDKPIQCSRMQACPQNYYCHIGFDDETTVCCPSSTQPCQAPLALGTGPHFVTRWYYDQSERQCKQFTYKGLHGNENNFLLKDHCEQTCPVFENPCANGDPVIGSDNKPKNCNLNDESTCPSTYWCHAGITTGNVCCPGKQDPCVLAVVEGTGNSVQQRWYFDLTDKSCKQFVYRGLRGNSVSFYIKI